jgi:Domain of unknown function (DUF1772)
MEELGNTFNIVSDLVRLLSAASWGMFAGAMLTEGLVLVPYWRSLTPSEFFVWYKANDKRLLDFFGPLTSLTALFAIVAAFISLWQSHPSKWLGLVTAIISIVVISTFFLYFQKANASFATASLKADDVARELTRWATWHWWRTILSLVALILSMLSLW